MNLKPTIAARIVDAILRELPDQMEHEPHRERWTTLVLAELESRSIPFDGYSTTDPAIIEAFIQKYPQVRDVLLRIERLAQILGARVSTSLTNDPEYCHVCCEGQHIVARVAFKTYGDLNRYALVRGHADGLIILLPEWG